MRGVRGQKRAGPDGMGASQRGFSRRRAPSAGRGQGPQARPGLGPGRAPSPLPCLPPSGCPGLSSTPRRRSLRAPLRMRHANCATTPLAPAATPAPRKRRKSLSRILPRPALPATAAR